MSLIPHGFFPRSLFDMDTWHGQQNHGQANTLDLFDPFDQLDHMIGRNLQWLNKPEFLRPALPHVPQKYRIIVDCAGYNHQSIKTELKDLKLSVWAREEVKKDDEDYHVKEFKKTYQLPEHAETDKLVSFFTSNGQLVIEVPLKETDEHPNDDLFPKIVDTKEGGKAVTMQFTVPEKIHPEKIHVNIKDRDLIVKAEDKVKNPDGISKFYYYKRTTLPENTDFKSLKCNYDNHRIEVSAPLNLDFKSYRSVPIEAKSQQPAIKQ